MTLRGRACQRTYPSEGVRRARCAQQGTQQCLDLDPGLLAGLVAGKLAADALLASGHAGRRDPADLAGDRYLGRLIEQGQDRVDRVAELRWAGGRHEQASALDEVHVGYCGRCGLPFVLPICSQQEPRATASRQLHA